MTPLECGLLLFLVDALVSSSNVWVLPTWMEIKAVLLKKVCIQCVVWFVRVLKMKSNVFIYFTDKGGIFFQMEWTYRSLYLIQPGCLGCENLSPSFCWTGGSAGATILALALVLLSNVLNKEFIVSNGVCKAACYFSNSESEPISFGFSPPPRF